MTAYPDTWITAAAEAAHRALDAADDGWHYNCLTEPNDPKDCYKGDYARAMLVEDIMPAVLAELGRIGALAGPTPADGPPAACREETWSWKHFNQDQADPYWIRCTLQGPHGEHKDEHTGLTWTTAAEETP